MPTPLDRRTVANRIFDAPEDVEEADKQLRELLDAPTTKAIRSVASAPYVPAPLNDAGNTLLDLATLLTNATIAADEE